MAEAGEILCSPVRKSESIGSLVKALADASKKFGVIAKDAENPFYKNSYADLATMIAATRPALADNGLAVMQWPLSLDSRAGVTTLLAHSSGEWIESDLTLPVTKMDAQGSGSAITYSRRYGYQSILNVAGEEDDDGNAATGKTKKQVLDKIEEAENSFDQRTEGDQYLAIFQMRGIQELAKTHGRTDSQIQTFIKQEFGVERIEKVKKADFDKLKAFVLGKIPIQEALQQSMEATRSDSQTSSGRRITEPQLKRLHAIRNAKKVPEADVKRYVFELKGPEHLADLDLNMYKVVVSWLESVNA